jgi:hypothetical protein
MPGGAGDHDSAQKIPAVVGICRDGTIRHPSRYVPCQRRFAATAVVPIRLLTANCEDLLPYQSNEEHGLCSGIGLPIACHPENGNATPGCAC